MVLSELTFIAVILLIGLLSAILAKRLKVPSVLFLVIVGIGFGIYMQVENITLSLPTKFISGLGLFTLILVVFESTAQIRFRELDKASIFSLKMTFATVLINFIILSFFTLLVVFRMNTEYMFLSILFAALMCGTAPDIILSLLGSSKLRIIRYLEIESIINTPLTVILPFLVIDLQRGVSAGFFSGFAGDLLLKITSGLGAGLLLGLIIFKVMRKQYSERYSPIAIITAALLSYVLAENIGGSGIIAVTTLGLFFGNLEFKQKYSLLQFESVLSTLLKVLIFVLLGIIIKIPLSFTFLWTSLLLFGIYLLGRYLAIYLVAPRMPSAHKIFMSLTASKGLAVVVVTFILASAVTGFEPILDYILAFVLYSLVLSSIIVWFSPKLIGEKIKEAKIVTIAPPGK
ncbi:cation:proton antiporter [Candidatus Woesearchaeota archaeon]|nr:cation:proton antiporter [Candidatus Woesearchaeota archaeon]